MLSAGPDGEGLEVVGEDAPGRPGPCSVVASEAAAAQAVAAFEVADAAFGADAVAGQAPVGASGAGALAAGNERALSGWEVLVDRAGREPAVEGNLTRGDPDSVELGAGGGQQVGLVRRADLR